MVKLYKGEEDVFLTSTNPILSSTYVLIWNRKSRKLLKKEMLSVEEAFLSIEVNEQ